MGSMVGPLCAKLGIMGCHIFGNKAHFCHIGGGGGKKKMSNTLPSKSEGPIFSLKMDNPQRSQIKALKNGLDLLHNLWPLQEPKAMVYV